MKKAEVKFENITKNKISMISISDLGNILIKLFSPFISNGIKEPPLI